MANSWSDGREDFRRIHGLDVALEAFASFHRERPSTALLMVGDGFERPRIEQRAAELGIASDVVFTGSVPFDRVPEYVAAMDVTVVTARPGEGFHYSPLKFREYMATERPVVAPRVGEMSRNLTNGTNALLYDPGNAAELAGILRQLHDDPGLRAKVAWSGRQLVLRTGTRDVQLERLLDSEPYHEALQRRRAAEG